VILNGLDPVKFWDPTVQNELGNLTNEVLGGATTLKLAKTVPGYEFVPYAVRAALTANQSVKVVDPHGRQSPVWGESGITPEWAKQKGISQDEETKNRGLWIASLNAKDLPADIGPIANFSPLDAGKPPQGYNFFEGVYFVLWIDGVPTHYVASSQDYNDQCGAVQRLVAGRCGAANASACKLYGVPQLAEKICTFDKGGYQPVSCTFNGHVAAYPVAIYANTKTCD